MTPSEISGWFDFDELYKSVVANAKDRDVLVEVGSWLGRSTAHMAQYIKDSEKQLRFWAIDHGFGTRSEMETPLHAGPLAENGGNIAGKMVSNLRECGVLDYVCPLIMRSVPASYLFADESLTFVFLDAAHDHFSVLNDLTVWWPKIKPGGMLAGHDYLQTWTGVKEAVDAFFGHACFDLISTSCWSKKKDE